MLSIKQGTDEANDGMSERGESRRARSDDFSVHRRLASAVFTEFVRRVGKMGDVHVVRGLTSRGQWAILALLALGALILPGTARAGEDTNNPRYASIVVDAESGNILYSRRADSQRYPASLTKMMTLYELFQALEEGRVQMTDSFAVSASAANQAPSKLGLRAGTRIKVEDCILGLVIQSANDVAVVIAEGLAGSERSFAKQMTEQAATLGMNRTVYRNASGLPDPGQITTARDLSMLAFALYRDFPQYTHYFATESFVWGGHRYKTHNHLLGKINGVDGLKTGYTRASGFNLATSAVRDGHRIIAVVMGGRSAGSRDVHMASLIKEQFAQLAKGGSTGSGETLVAAGPTPRPKPTALLAATGAAPASRSSLGVVPSPKPGSENTRAMASLETQYQSDEGSGEGSVDGVVTSLLVGPAHASTGSQSTDSEQRWGIQIGAYISAASAETRLEEARASLPALLSNTPWAVIPVSTDGATFYRARFGPFNEVDAENACKALGPHGFKCFKVPPEQLSSLNALPPQP